MILLKENTYTETIYELAGLSEEFLIEIPDVKAKYGIAVAVYRSPRKGDFKKFINKQEEALTWLTAKYPNANFLIVGDFNVDIKVESEEKEKLEMYWHHLTFTNNILNQLKITKTCNDNVFTYIEIVYRKTLNMHLEIQVNITFLTVVQVSYVFGYEVLSIVESFGRPAGSVSKF